MQDAFEEYSEIKSIFIDRPAEKADLFGVSFDRLKLDDVVSRVDTAARSGERFAYVVTPNVDHVVRNASSPELAAFYNKAWLTLCDSKPLSWLATMLGYELPHVTGADLTATLFEKVLRNGDRVALIASEQEVVDRLCMRYPELNIRAYIPPLGVKDDPAKLRKCVDFIVSERNNFVFIAIGAPQSEAIAYAVSRVEGATGVGLCVGASLEFITGMKQRAPSWMSRSGLEWLHRLLTDKRLWRRYAFSILPLLHLVVGELRRKRLR